jgi:hypothetical protein
VSLGGTDDPSNLVAACRDCNAGKASTAPGAPLVADVAQDAMRWAAAIKHAAAVMEADTRKRYELNVAFDNLWTEVCPSSWQRPSDWPDTLNTFRAHGLPQAEIDDAFFVMAGKDSIAWSARWRYFCGICWRKITAIQQAAIALIEADGDL